MSPPRYATFRDAIEANAARTPDAPFVLAPEPDATLTWKGLAASCDALAAAMERMDVKPGEVVGFMLTNGLSALTVFLGAMAGGYVVAPFNLLAQDAQLDYVLGHAGPQVVFAETEYAGRLRAACARSGAATRIVEVDVDGLGLELASPRERRGLSGRSAGDADVHVRDDGRAEGRAADACEHAVCRRHCGGAPATRPGRSRAVIATAVSHQRPVHRDDEHVDRRRQHRTAAPVQHLAMVASGRPLPSDVAQPGANDRRLSVERPRPHAAASATPSRASVMHARHQRRCRPISSARSNPASAFPSSKRWV